MAILAARLSPKARRALIVFAAASGALLLLRYRQSRARCAAAASADPGGAPNLARQARANSNRDDSFPVIADAAALPPGWLVGPLLAPFPGVLCKQLIPAADQSEAPVEACFIAAAVVPRMTLDAAAKDGADAPTADAETVAGRLLALCPFVAADDRSAGLSGATVTAIDSVGSGSGASSKNPLQVEIRSSDVVVRGGFATVGPASDAIQLAITLVVVGGAPSGALLDTLSQAIDVDSTIQPRPAGRLVAVPHEDESRERVEFPLVHGAPTELARGVDSATSSPPQLLLRRGGGKDNDSIADLTGMRVVYVNDEAGVRFSIPQGLVVAAPFGVGHCIEFTPLPATRPTTTFSVHCSTIPRGWEVAASAASPMLADIAASRVKHNITTHLLGPSHAIGAWHDVDVGGRVFTSVDSIQGEFGCRTLATEVGSGSLMVLRCTALSHHWDETTEAFRKFIDTVYFTS